jgi:hypothetical protein
MKKTTSAILSCIMVFLIPCNLITQAQQNAQTKQRERGAVVYDLPRMDDVIIKKDIPYQDISGSTLKMDIYYPPDFNFQTKVPAIIIVWGFSDIDGKKLLGSEFKNYIQYVSWCKLISASGMAAIAYETINPEKDIISLSNYLKANADKLKIDNGNIGAFTCSGHTPTAVSNILNGSNSIFKCAVVYYGVLLTKDFKYLSQIDSLIQSRGALTPTLPDPSTWKKDVPIMIVRAGNDNTPYLNLSITNFYEKALNQNLPITLINYPEGLHGFEIYNDNETTRQIIKNTIEFWKSNLKQ